MKDLQNWRISDGIDFISYVKYIIAVTDPEYRPGFNITLKKLVEILDRIIIISSFSCIDLRRKIKKKYI